MKHSQDEERMIQMQTRIIEIIDAAKAYIDANGGLHSVYFVACGGSWSSQCCGYMLVENQNTLELSTGHLNSNEFVHAMPRTVNGHSIVIVTSMKATAESVEALRVAKAAGAYTIAITGGPDTLMARTANSFVVYTHSENWTCAMHSQAMSVRIGAEILRRFQAWDKYDATVVALDSLNERYARVLAANQRKAIKFALDYRDEKLFHIFSCGTMYGAGYGAAYCHLMEMQQLNAIPVNSSEYFHGFFESTTPDQPSVIFMNLGSTRPLDERALRFLQQFCDRLVVLDANEYGLEDVDPAIVEYIAPLITSPLFRMFVEKLSVERKHPMTLRRYMWKFDY